MTLSDDIQKSNSLKTQTFENKIKIGILSSFTIKGLEKSLQARCASFKIGSNTYMCGYNQYNQDILNLQSNLYKFSPDITFLILDTRSILGDLFYSPYKIDAASRKKFIINSIDNITNLCQTFIKNSNSKLVISNFSIPTYSSYGIYEHKTEYGLKEMIWDLNKKLNEFVKNTSSVFLYDFNSFITKFGETNVFDYRQFFIGDIKIALNHIPKLADELLAFIKPIVGLNRKCIVLDLDNTLWGGVVGEDGFEGIHLSSKSPGNAFVEFQRHLLSLHERGIILAINSKNNEDEAMKVIQEHPDMILREENFACFKINWKDKVSNIKEIAFEINIGLDSMVFVDDDPVNREFMKKSLPEVLTIDLPKDPSYFSQTLMSLTDFNVMKITEEDKKRGKMYQQQLNRTKLLNTSNSLQDFLNELNITVKIKKNDKFSIPRISQLTLKTNQFNLTTRRYQEEDIKNFSQNNDIIVGSAEVEDKFGNNGISGAFIVRKNNPKEWNIDTFLLSCRVIGRGVEDAIMSHILIEAKNQKIERVYASYVPTKKNIPCKSFLDDFGFKKEGENWVFDTKNDINIPKHIVLK